VERIWMIGGQRVEQFGQAGADHRGRLPVRMDVSSV
jgi:hypothetical protein